MLLAAIVFIAVSSVLLRAATYYENLGYRYTRLSPGTTTSRYMFAFYPVMNQTGPWLFVLSVGLGLAIGVRQFWIPNFTRTWPFLLHRSVNRTTILAAKLTAASIAFIIAIVPIWVGIYWYITRPEIFIVPPPLRVFVEGWVFIILGFVTYLGTALSGLSTAKWYTTKIFGLLFVLAIFTTLSMWTLGGLLIALIVSAVILLLQIFQTFGRREF
jgi:hypothetical protein